MVVLVTGANGQLGQAIQFIAKNYSNFDFVFCTSSDLDITNKAQCNEVFSKYKPNFCINAAAYTAVDKAESEPEKADLINHIGARNIAQTCKDFNTVLLHISTDFVFDGNQNVPYSENDIPNPRGIYGKTKLAGEIAVQNFCQKYYIIRTSWVYSQFGSNFMKTMLRLSAEKSKLTIVDDQIGTPTNANELAECLLKICLANAKQLNTNTFGIYNFSNEGNCSWFDFAKEIFNLNQISIDLQPIPTTSFPTPAQRPKYSVLDKSKIKNTFGIEIKSWKESLKDLF